LSLIHTEEVEQAEQEFDRGQRQRKLHRTQYHALLA
jgi:hypothetical protein